MFRGLATRVRSCRPSIPQSITTKTTSARPRSYPAKHYDSISVRNSSFRTQYEHARKSSLLETLRESSSQLPRLIFIAISIYVVCHVFAEHFFDFGQAYGISMLPTISSYGDTLIFSQWYRRGRDIRVGDVVCYRHPLKQDVRAVKRVVGMPGDYVLKHTPDSGDGIMIQVPEGHCWVNGDNLKHSRDSRHFGPLPLALITGKVIGRMRFEFPPQFERLEDSTALD